MQHGGAQQRVGETGDPAGAGCPSIDQLAGIYLQGWKDGLARKNYVAILELMGKPAGAGTAAAAAPKHGTLEVAGKMTAAPADPVVDAYRRKLSMALN